MIKRIKNFDFSNIALSVMGAIALSIFGIIWSMYGINCEQEKNIDWLFKNDEQKATEISNIKNALLENQILTQKQLEQILIRQAEIQKDIQYIKEKIK